MSFLLRDLFGFAEHQEEAWQCLGSKFLLTWNSDNSVLNNDNATNLDKIEIIGIEWYVPVYTSSIP